MLEFVHDEDALYGGYVGKPGEHVEQEALVVFHVGGKNLEEKIVGSADVVALGHFWNALHRGAEAIHYFGTQPLHLYGAENGEAPVELFSVDDGDIAVNEAFALQTPYALEYGRGTQIYARGEFFGGKAGVCLKLAENADVGFVELHKNYFLKDVL